MYDRASNKKSLICRRKFDVTAGDLLGFSDEDINDSKDYFELFERSRKLYLNPVVALKRLPRNYLYNGTIPIRKGASVKQRCSSRRMRSIISASQSRTRKEEENDDVECSPVQIIPEIGYSSMKSHEGKMEEAFREKIVLAQEARTIETNIRKRRAETVLQPENDERIHSSKRVESFVEDELKDVVDRIDNKNGTSLRSAHDKTANGIETAPNGRLKSSKRLKKSWPMNIDEYPVEFDWSIGSPSVPAERNIEGVATSQNSTACKAKERTHVENVCLPMSLKVIHSSHQLDDSFLKLRVSPKNPNQPSVKTKHDANEYLSTEDDMICIAKCTEFEKTTYDFVDEVSSLPKVELVSLPPVEECETKQDMVGTDICADFDDVAEGPLILPQQEWLDRRNCHPPSSTKLRCERHKRRLVSSRYTLNREMPHPLAMTQDTSKIGAGQPIGTVESQSMSPTKKKELILPQSEKIWTILKPCVVRLERVSELDNLVKKYPISVFGMRMMYKFKHTTNTPAIFSELASENQSTLCYEYDENTEKSAVGSCGKNECALQTDTQKKIDLSDGLALKKFCELESVVIEDSDTEQEVHGQTEQASPLVHSVGKTISPNKIVPVCDSTAVAESSRHINSVGSLHESDLLQHEPFQIANEKLCDSIWSDVLNFREPDESEIEDVSAQESSCNPLAGTSYDVVPPVKFRHSGRLGEVGPITDVPVSGSNADTPGSGFDQRRLDPDHSGLDLNSDLERVKQFGPDDLCPCPEKGNSTDSSFNHLLNSKGSSIPAESLSPVCSNSPRKIRLKVARNRGKTAEGDVSYTYSYGKNSESVNLPEYETLADRPFKRLKRTHENLSDTIIDHGMSHEKSSVKVYDSLTPIKEEKIDQQDLTINESIDKVRGTKANHVPTNPFHVLSTIPYIFKCNLQNRCRRCKGLKPCATANKKFKLFFTLNVGAGRSLSQPLLDALRNREDPCTIDETSAYIAASAVVKRPCTVLVPAVPELVQIMLPPHISNMIMGLVTETTRMECNERKSIEASAIAEALQIRRELAARRTKPPSKIEINDTNVKTTPVYSDIQAVMLQKILSERPFLPYRCNQIIATKSKLDNRFNFLRKCMVPVIATDSKSVRSPSKETAEARLFCEIIDTPMSECHIEWKEDLSPKEIYLDDHEGKDVLSSSDLSGSAPPIDIRSTVQELMPPRYDSLSMGTAAISCDDTQPSSLEDKSGISLPLKRAESSVEPDPANMDESVQREPKTGSPGVSSGDTLSDVLCTKPGDGSNVHSSSTRLYEEPIDGCTGENVSDLKFYAASHVGEGLGEGIIESSSAALMNLNLTDVHEPTVDPIPDEITDEGIEDPVPDHPSPKLFVDGNKTLVVLPRDSKHPSEGFSHTDLLTQTEEAGLIMPFDVMADKPTSVQKLNNKDSSSRPSDWSLALPPLIAISSKVTDSAPHVQVPAAGSSAQIDQDPSPQPTSDDTPDVIIVPNKFESIDLTNCEEENQSICNAATIDLSNTKRTPSVHKSTPISREPIPEWGVICSSLPKLGYVKVEKIGSRLVIYDNTIVTEPLGFHNIHEVNRFLNSQLADPTYLCEKKIALEWIVVTSGYIKLKNLPPTNSQLWKHPSTAAETQKDSRDYIRKLNLSKLEASKRLKESSKGDSPVILSTCSIAEKKSTAKTKPSRRSKSMADQNHQKLSKDGKTVRINGQMVSMGTPVTHSRTSTSPNVHVGGTCSTSPSSPGGIVVSPARSPVSAATVITSVSKGSKDSENAAVKIIRTCASGTELTAPIEVTKNSSLAVSTSTVSTNGTALVASRLNKAHETILVSSSPEIVSSAPSVNTTSVQSVQDGLSAKSIPGATGSLGKSVSRGSMGYSRVSIPPGEQSRLTLVGLRKTPLAQSAIAKKPPSKASYKTARLKPSGSSTTRTESITIDPAKQVTPTTYREIVVTPGMVKCIVLTNAVTATKNALSYSSSHSKCITNTTATTTKRTSVASSRHPVAVTTATKTSTGTSSLVQKLNSHTNTQSYVGSPGGRSRRLPILILRNSAPAQALLPPKRAIRALLQNK